MKKARRAPELLTVAVAFDKEQSSYSLACDARFDNVQKTVDFNAEFFELHDIVELRRIRQQLSEQSTPPFTYSYKDKGGESLPIKESE